MRRSSRGRKVGLLAWMLGAAVTGGLLVALFTFTDPARTAGEWPLGIGTAEVDLYASWADRRGNGTAGPEPERYLISGPAGDCLLERSTPGWSTQWFEAEGYGDSVKVRPLGTAEGGFAIEFGRGELFRSQRRILLVPATVESIRAKYLEVIARELGLITPEVSFVRVIACGLDRGIHMKEEHVGPEFLEKQGAAGACLFTQGHDAARPDHLFPDFEKKDSLTAAMLRGILAPAYADLSQGRTTSLRRIVDVRAGVGLLLMEWIGQGAGAFGRENSFAYDRSVGRIVPLHRHAAPGDASGGAGPLSMNFFTALLKDASIRGAFVERREKLAEERWRLKERFAAMDRAWLPILAGDGSLARARAVAQRMQDELIGDRLEREDAFAVLDRPLVRHAGDASFTAGDRAPRSLDDERALAHIAERTKARVQGDTLVFPRGRYTIQEDLIVPYGRKVVLEQGVRIGMAPGVSMIVQGPLIVRGTTRNPVFVRALDEARPFGVLAMVGDGSATCSITGLHMSGGSSADVNGIRFSGQLAVHNAGRTLMSDCAISGSKGEDLVNIKGGEVLLHDCAFGDGAADLVDLDRCTGRVEKCAFGREGPARPGDGVSLDASRVLIAGCSFNGSFGRGVNAGAASQVLVRGSRFRGNAIALAAKDLSVAYAEGNTFLDNGIVFKAHRKEPVHGGARVVRCANEYVGNGREQEVDELSAVVPQEALPPKVLKAFGAE